MPQELQFESSLKETFALLILTLITRHITTRHITTRQHRLTKQLNQSIKATLLTSVRSTARIVFLKAYISFNTTSL